MLRNWRSKVRIPPINATAFLDAELEIV
jgi:hypothetical protein